eukprot:scaffold13220_cov91-Cylindrotheca_fusiformis.AAC.4
MFQLEGAKPPETRLQTSYCKYRAKNELCQSSWACRKDNQDRNEGKYLLDRDEENGSVLALLALSNWGWHTARMLLAYNSHTTTRKKYQEEEEE